jgi:hypothetical protein
MKRIARRMKKSQTESDSIQYTEQSATLFCVRLTCEVLILIDGHFLNQFMFLKKKI